MSLGGIMLCITGKCMHLVLFIMSRHYKQNHSIVNQIYLFTLPGSEAMFADLGHFSQLSIKVQYNF